MLPGHAARLMRHGGQRNDHGVRTILLAQPCTTEPWPHPTLQNCGGNPTDPETGIDRSAAMNKLDNTEMWVCPDQVFDGQRLLSGYAVRIQSGRVIGIAPTAALDPHAKRLPLVGILSPGFVDLQVNGGGGRFLNAEPTTGCMIEIAAAHHKLGTTSILPTVITDAREVLDRAVDAAIEAAGEKGIAGLHIEGPHISIARRGTHAERHIRPLEKSTLSHAARLRGAGVPLMLTIAPEACTDAQIAELTEMGVVVSLGHSDCDANRAETAIASGARAATHLFNAMSPMENRAPGLTGTVINSEICAGIICDGVHVDDRMVGLAFRARPCADSMFLVSDAMPTVGGPDQFSLYGLDITREGNRLVNSEGSLAGAHTTMAIGVARLVQKVGLDPETALRAAIHVPSRLMGLDLDQLEGREVDDLLHLDHSCALVQPLGKVLLQA